MLSGENSILQRVTDAKTKNDIVRAEERIKLAQNAALTSGLGKITYNNLINELNNEFGKNKYIIYPEDESATEWTVTIETSSGNATVTIQGVKPEEFSYSELKIGDYVNFPIYYENVFVYSYGIDNTEYGWTASNDYNNWRILDVDTENGKVKLIPAGVPLCYYHYNNPTLTVSNLTSSFFNINMNVTTKTYNHFHKCGFKKSRDSEETINNTSDLEELFNNNLVEIQEGKPNVRALTKEDVDKILDSSSEYGTDVSDNDLLAVPCKEGSYSSYVKTILATSAEGPFIWVINR